MKNWDHTSNWYYKMSKVLMWAGWKAKVCSSFSTWSIKLYFFLHFNLQHSFEFFRLSKIPFLGNTKGGIYRDGVMFPSLAGGRIRLRTQPSILMTYTDKGETKSTPISYKGGLSISNIKAVNHYFNHILIN